MDSDLVPPAEPADDPGRARIASPRYPAGDSVRRVQRSVAGLAGRELELAEGFRAHLAAIVSQPDLSIPDGMLDELTESVPVLLAVIAALDDPEAVARLMALGARLDAWGVPEELYPFCARALVRSVQDLSGSSWSTRLSSAWVSVYSWSIAQMEAGARRTRQPPLPAADAATVFAPLPWRRRPGRKLAAVVVLILLGLGGAATVAMVQWTSAGAPRAARSGSPTVTSPAVVTATLGSSPISGQPTGTAKTSPSPTPKPATSAPTPSRSSAHAPAAPTPPPRTTTSSRPTTTKSPCRVSYQFSSVWQNGFVVTITFTNTSTAAWSGWAGSFGMSTAATVRNSWGASLTAAGSLVKVDPAAYNDAVPAGGTATIGFQADTTAPVRQLGPFSVNGATCSVSP